MLKWVPPDCDNKIENAFSKHSESSRNCELGCDKQSLWEPSAGQRGLANNSVSATKACPFTERFQGKSVNTLEQRGLQAFFKSLRRELLLLCDPLHTLNLSDSCLSSIIGSYLTLPHKFLTGLYHKE